MRTHSRWITVGIAAGLLALVGASLLQAQQPQQQPRDSARETGAVTSADTLNRLAAPSDSTLQKQGRGGL